MDYVMRFGYNAGMRIEKLSLYIVTKNEEKRLPMVLESVRGIVDEIVVVDSGSTDRTEEIARAFGARFLHHGRKVVSNGGLFLYTVQQLLERRKSTTILLLT